MKLENEDKQGEASTSGSAAGDQGEAKTAGQPLADFLMQLEDYTPTVITIFKHIYNSFS
jgi:hypothetical protein